MLKKKKEIYKAGLAKPCSINLARSPCIRLKGPDLYTPPPPIARYMLPWEGCNLGWGAQLQVVGWLHSPQVGTKSFLESWCLPQTTWNTQIHFPIHIQGAAPSGVHWPVSRGNLGRNVTGTNNSRHHCSWSGHLPPPLPIPRSAITLSHHSVAHLVAWSRPSSSVCLSPWSSCLSQVRVTLPGHLQLHLGWGVPRSSQVEHLGSTRVPRCPHGVTAACL